ncbi:MAG: Flagellar hook-length control protein FliK, partial [Pseudomonadota bacterium]
TAATGNLVRITGTTATTGVTINNGQVVLCYPTGAWPLTYHVTNMPIKGGASYTCAAGDTVLFSKDGNGTLHVDIVPVAMHPAIVSQAVAEAGTDTTARLWTAERVKQAIEVSAASQAQMEAAASSSVFATPSVIKYSPYALKAWCIATMVGTPAIAGDVGVSGISDDGTGLTTVTWDTAFANPHYSTVAMGGLETNYAFCVTRSRTSGAWELAFVDHANTLRDVAVFTLMAAGDQ